MIFQKPSTRTRVSFEVGIAELGGHGLYLAAGDLQLGRGETIKDTAVVLSRYLDAIMIRTFAQDDVEQLAEHASVPVINGLTDYAHPCQALADLMTIRERLSRLSGVRLAYLGDGNNVCISLMVAAARCGMRFVAATPEGYEPDATAVSAARRAAVQMGGTVELVRDPADAAREAQVVYTDVWTSMGQEDDSKRRRKDLAGYQIDDELLSHASPDAIVLHCLPAHYGEEITEDVLYGPQSAVWDQAENRLHAQKALLALIVDLSVPDQGQRPDEVVPRRHGRADRDQLRGLDLLPAPQSRPLGRRVRLPAVRGRQLLPARDRGRPRLGRHVVDLDVHARKLAAHHREHALPLDLRQQRRGRDGAASASSASTCWPGSPRPRLRPSSPSGRARMPTRRSRTSGRAARSRAFSAPISCSCRPRAC